MKYETIEQVKARLSEDLEIALKDLELCKRNVMQYVEDVPHCRQAHESLSNYDSTNRKIRYIRTLLSYL